ncbi:hypothetical protein PORY_001718 [Pneumocystis oryctolagi]|uniref:Uncharacterized protein n=1 Tax=Pneumocystis oryctolagi TaxID=42067 RepID=A0ACB7CDK7_9ASCO|nr:hypothetical protein PORY_001718 [Pneumocystis oryctolagi]
MAKISLIGRVGNDIVVESGPSGRDYIRFSLACQNGPDRTSWFRVINFDAKQNAYMLSSVKKGALCGCFSTRVTCDSALVYVDGSVQLSPYTTEDGKRHTSLSVIQRSIQVLKEPRDKEDSDNSVQKQA